MKKLHLTVSGRVQGVGFRYSTYALALELGEIYGRVWNTDNGNVEIHVQSDNNEKLTQFIQTIRKGPSRWAKVNYVNIQMTSFPDYHDFKIQN